MTFYKGIIILAFLMGVNTLSFGFDIEKWWSELQKENQSFEIKDKERKISEKIRETRKRKRFRSIMRDEKRDLQFDRREVNQVKQWDARLNRVLTDIHGNRVRVQQFITRPESNQVKFTAVTKRKNRLDYMWFLQEFNGDLPKDIKGIAFRCYWGTEPQIYPVKQTKYISNSQDSITYLWENLTLEHIGTPDPNRPELELWSLWFKKTTWKVNDRIKQVFDFDADPIEQYDNESYNGVYNNGAKWYKTVFPWDNNSYLMEEKFIADDSGNVIDIIFGTAQEKIEIQEKYNIEFVYTATEFEGRKIDLILVPRIFLKYVVENSLFPDNPYIMW